MLDRATLLRSIAEAYEERTVEEKERGALRRARRAAIKSGTVTGEEGTSANRSTEHRAELALAGRNGDGHPQLSPAGGIIRGGPGSEGTVNGNPTEVHAQLASLRDRVHEALAAGERVTGETIAQWLGVSPRTGRRRLAVLVEEDPVLSDALTRE